MVVPVVHWWKLEAEGAVVVVERFHHRQQGFVAGMVEVGPRRVVEVQQHRRYLLVEVVVVAVVVVGGCGEVGDHPCAVEVVDDGVGDVGGDGGGLAEVETYSAVVVVGVVATVAVAVAPPYLGGWRGRADHCCTVVVVVAVAASAVVELRYLEVGGVDHPQMEEVVVVVAVAVAVAAAASCFPGLPEKV